MMKTLGSLHNLLLRSLSTMTTTNSIPTHWTTTLNLSSPPSPTPTLHSIKSAFRKLAKIHHPDLDLPTSSQEKMTSLLVAYEQALDAVDAESGRITHEMEIFTVPEMKLMTDHYRVIDFEICLEESVKLGGGGGDGGEGEGEGDGGDQSEGEGEGEGGGEGEGEDDSEVILVSEYDSVSDLKRKIQKNFATALGVSDRPLDKENLHPGWEVLFKNTALSYHLLVCDYNVANGDKIFVVVNEKWGEKDRVDLVEKAFKATQKVQVVSSEERSGKNRE